PLWHSIALGSFAALSIVLAMFVRDRFSRLLGLPAIILGAIMLVTRVPVAEHHLVGRVPVIVAVAAVAWCRPPLWRATIGGALCLAYLGIALIHDATFIRNLRATGGHGDWSDAVNAVAADKEARKADF